MKEHLKECVKCHTAIDHFWLYHFKVTWKDIKHKTFLYEFDEFFF